MTIAYHKHFALFHVRFRETLGLLDFYQFQPILGSPCRMKILLDEITLETYDRPGSKKYFEKFIYWSL